MIKIVEQTKQKFEELPQNSRILIIVCGILFVCLFSYVFLLKPIQNKIETLTTNNQKLTKDYNIIANYSVNDQKNTTKHNVDNKTSLESAIDKISKKYQLEIAKITRSGKNAVSIEIGKIDSVDLFSFIYELENKYEIFVQNMDLEVIDEQTVKIRKLLLGRGDIK